MFSTKIATLQGIFPARNPTEVRHSVSVDHYTEWRKRGHVVSIRPGF